VVFAATLPTVGPGALRQREDESAFYDTDKETTLYAPRHPMWREVGEQCAEEGIGLNMILGMDKPIDVGTIG
jgi:protein transport protein SEC24